MSLPGGCAQIKADRKLCIHVTKLTATWFQAPAMSIGYLAQDRRERDERSAELQVVHSDNGESTIEECRPKGRRSRTASNLCLSAALSLCLSVSLPLCLCFFPLQAIWRRAAQLSAHAWVEAHPASARGRLGLFVICVLWHSVSAAITRPSDCLYDTQILHHLAPYKLGLNLNTGDSRGRSQTYNAWKSFTVRHRINLQYSRCSR